jgi:hypothetical protein
MPLSGQLHPWNRRAVQNNVSHNTSIVWCSSTIKVGGQKGSNSFPAHRQIPPWSESVLLLHPGERRLLEKAAKLEHRSLSSFVALASIERAKRIVAGK